MCLQIVMNCEIIKSFILQLKMKKIDINKFYLLVSKFKTFDNIILRTYLNYILLIKIVDQTNYVNLGRHDFIAINMINIKLILKLSRLIN